MCRILHVEDDSWFAEEVSNRINSSAQLLGTSAISTNVRTLKEADRLSRTGFDVILLDLSLQDSNPERTLAWLNQNAYILPPVIVISGTMNDKHEPDSYASGAQDFIHRENLLTYPHNLWHSIRACIMRRADSNERYNRARSCRAMAITAVLLIGLFAGCSGPGKSKASKAAYLMCPQTVSMGVFMPESKWRTESALFSLSATWQLRPFIPPHPQPSLR